jgi:CHAT domain-containing protein/tetratricopeptide (TPR) repeat protein
MFHSNRWRSIVILSMLTFLSMQMVMCKGVPSVIEQKAEVDRLLNSGNQYSEKGQYQEAIKLYLQSLAIVKQSGDLEGEGFALNSLGNVYNRLGQYKVAIDYYKQSLLIKKKIGTQQSEVTSLTNLGSVYENLGQDQIAINYHKQSSAILMKTNDYLNAGKVLGNIANVFSHQKQYKRAIEFHLQALVLSRKINDHKSEGNILGNIGNVYNSLEQYQKAIDYHQQSLEISRKTGGRNEQAIALNNLGNSHRYLKRYQNALNYYQQSLRISQEIGTRNSEGKTLSNMGDVFVKLNKPEIAIVFYKQSVNTREFIRQDIRGLSRKDQESYLSTVSDTYRHLADVLIQENRILEAQQVLDLFKVEELNEYLRGTRGDVETAKEMILQISEKNIIALSNELMELQQLEMKGKLSSSQRLRHNLLINNEKDYSKQFNAFLQRPEVQKEIDRLRRSQSGKNIDIEIYPRLRDKLKNAALFYPLVLDDRLELIFITDKTPPIRRTIPLKRTELNRAILAFQDNLRNIRPIEDDAKKFYNWLIKPFESELKQANIQIIVYAPDEGLRYIPLAALFDGQQWLVEKYRINNITSASLTDFNPHPPSTPHVLGAAATVKRDILVGDRTVSFSAIPYAKTEVENIATQLNTTKLIDPDFTEQALTGKLNSHNIVHLATHGHFEVGQPEQSFILLGDGTKSTISDIGTWKLTNVNLVVLSACETAIGGQGDRAKGIEIFGLGYQIHNAGASAAIASLWKVSDGGTQKLMDAFYTAVKTGKVSNAEALRQAQVAMITGNFEGLGQARGVIEIRLRSHSADIPSKLSHPYYWAPFILIGNGL